MKSFFGWLLRFAFKTAIISVAFIVVITFLKGGPSLQPEGEKKKEVAIVTLAGVIQDTQEFMSKLHKQVHSEDVLGVVVRINSPGGAVGPAQEIFMEIQKLNKKKPIVVSMGSVAASGGLYAALGASKIYALQGTLTGSIGVILSLPNLTELAQKVGVSFTTIKAGKLKDAGNTFREMTPQEEEYLTAVAKITHGVFIEDIAKARGLDEADVRKFADGRIILGSEAVEYGLIDEIGTLYDAARAVYELADEPLGEDEEPALKKPKEPFEDFKKLLEGMSFVPEILSQPTDGASLQVR